VDAVPILRILCLGSLATVLGQLIRSIFSGIGSPRVAAWGVYLFLVIVAVSIYPMTIIWGSIGTAWCMALGSLASAIFLFVAVSRRTECRLTAALKMLAPAFAGAFVMAVLVVWFRSAAEGPPRPSLLAAQVALGVISYSALAALFDRVLKTELISSTWAALSSVFRRNPPKKAPPIR
jgi:PST family polysaccharide transporter/lipopolysaccharide exporter